MPYDRKFSSWPFRFYDYPQELPYPTPIQRSPNPVPNASSVNWSQAQFAPLYLPPGSPSFQPYRYFDFQQKPVRLGLVSPQRLVEVSGGPSGDRARAPYLRNFGDAVEDLAGALAESDQVELLLDLPEGTLTAEAAPELGAELAPSDASDEVAAEQLGVAEFEQIDPELLEGFGNGLKGTIDRIEAAVIQLDAQPQLTPAAQAVREKLVAIHEKIRDRLEKHFDHRATRKGKGRKTLKHLRRRRSARRVLRRTARQAVASKAQKIDRIRAAYKQGKVDRRMAKFLVAAVLSGSSLRQAALAAKKPARAKIAAYKRKAKRRRG